MGGLMRCLAPAPGCERSSDARAWLPCGLRWGHRPAPVRANYELHRIPRLAQVEELGKEMAQGRCISKSI